MSVATEFAPTVFIPPQARPRHERLATVITLHPPREAGDPVVLPVRLTRRGMAVAAGLVASVAGVLVWLAALSAPSLASPSLAAHSVAAPATVTVRAGDTLWSIASRVAPNRDPRAEVAVLQRLNAMSGVDLVAGQVLRTH